MASCSAAAAAVSVARAGALPPRLPMGPPPLPAGPLGLGKGSMGPTRSGEVSEAPSESSANMEDKDTDLDDFQSAIPHLERIYAQMAAKVPGTGVNPNWMLSLARSYRRLSTDKRSRGRLRALLRPGSQGAAASPSVAEGPGWSSNTDDSGYEGGYETDADESELSEWEREPARHGHKRKLDALMQLTMRLSIVEHNEEPSPPSKTPRAFGTRPAGTRYSLGSSCSPRSGSFGQPSAASSDLCGVAAASSAASAVPVGPPPATACIGASASCFAAPGPAGTLHSSAAAVASIVGGGRTSPWAHAAAAPPQPAASYAGAAALPGPSGLFGWPVNPWRVVSRAAEGSGVPSQAAMAAAAASSPQPLCTAMTQWQPPAVGLGRAAALLAASTATGREDDERAKQQAAAGGEAAGHLSGAKRFGVEDGDQMPTSMEIG